MKLYFVNTLDTWNNITFIGIFDDLKKAKKIIMDNYEDEYDDMDEFELVEYASTFSMAFDKELYNEESGEYLRIFGYILTPEQLEDMTDID